MMMVPTPAIMSPPPPPRWPRGSTDRRGVARGVERGQAGPPVPRAGPRRRRRGGRRPAPPGDAGGAPMGLHRDPQPGLEVGDAADVVQVVVGEPDGSDPGALGGEVVEDRVEARLGVLPGRGRFHDDPLGAGAEDVDVGVGRRGQGGRAHGDQEACSEGLVARRRALAEVGASRGQGHQRLAHRLRERQLPGVEGRQRRLRPPPPQGRDLRGQRAPLVGDALGELQAVEDEVQGMDHAALEAPAPGGHHRRQVHLFRPSASR